MGKAVTWMVGATLGSWPTKEATVEPSENEPGESPPTLGEQDIASLTTIRQKLPPEEQSFLDGLGPEEKRSLLRLVEDRGIEGAVKGWDRLRYEIEEVRNFLGEKM